MTDLLHDHGANLRRLMARLGLTQVDVIERCGLDRRTIEGILAGAHKPHARTLHKLAAGLGVPADELFQDPSLLTHRLFDRATNPAVEEVVASQPQLFQGWTQAEFAELYSRFGHGGALTHDGALDAVALMNQKRDIQRKVALLLETAEGELLCGFVDLLYQRVRVRH